MIVKFCMVGICVMLVYIASAVSDLTEDVGRLDAQLHRVKIMSSCKNLTDPTGECVTETVVYKIIAEASGYEGEIH